jgi:hypothetical protein
VESTEVPVRTFPFLGPAVLVIPILVIPMAAAGRGRPARQTPGATAARVGVKVTQKYLVPVCVDHAPVKEGEREWHLIAGGHSLTFTMRNDPRPGMGGGDRVPGTARVSFTLVTGHEYEVEIRAPATTYGTRVWTRGEWKPVVRDRTEDRIVSSDPEWTDGGCGSQPGREPPAAGDDSGRPSPACS